MSLNIENFWFRQLQYLEGILFVQNTLKESQNSVEKLTWISEDQSRYMYKVEVIKSLRKVVLVVGGYQTNWTAAPDLDLSFQKGTQ